MPVPKQSSLLQQPSAAGGPRWEVDGTARQLKKHKAWHSQAEGQQVSAAAKQPVKQLGPMQAAKLALAKASARARSNPGCPAKVQLCRQPANSGRESRCKADQVHRPGAAQQRLGKQEQHEESAGAASCSEQRTSAERHSISGHMQL